MVTVNALTHRERGDAIDRRLETLSEAGARVLVGTFVDNAGITRVKTVPIRRCSAVARHGVGLSPAFTVMCIDDHVTETGRFGGPVGDLRLIPDLEAAVVVDADRGLAWAPFDQYDQELTPFPLCQRDTLRRQEQRARALDLDFLAAVEIEFTLLGADGSAAHAGPGYGLGPLLNLEHFSLGLLAALQSAGVAVETLHPEYGPGQMEISLAPLNPVAAVDQLVLAKLVVSRTAQQHGLTASFAPMTIPDEIGNGSHVHFSATRDGHNVFADGPGVYGMTHVGEQLIAGLLHHLGDACGLFAPTIASYERLQPGHWSGAYACWGLENREAAVRLIRGTVGTRRKSANVEVKSVDGGSNPYLALAAIIGMAGTGVEEALQLPEPTDVDPDGLSADERRSRDIHRLPASLDEALSRLDASSGLRRILGHDLVDCLVAVRRYELSTYGECDTETRIQLVRSRY